MILKDLRREVCALGFDSPPDDEIGFITSVNRALRMIFTERPIEASARLIVKNPKPIFHFKKYTHATAASDKFTLFGRAVSFKVSGEGSYSIVGENINLTESFSTPYAVIRKFIYGEVELTFFGAFSYEVRDICCFEEARSAEYNDIPVYSERISIPLDRHICDMLSASRAPEDCLGNRIETAEVRGNLLIIPYEFDGEIIVYYNRLPKTIFGEDNEEIDIAEDSLHLLALLTASYLWLDSEPEKAQYYMQLYREAIQLLKMHTPRGVSPDYHDCLRWA